MSKRIKFTAEQIEQVRSLADIESGGQIAERFGCSYETIKRLAYDYNISGKHLQVKQPSEQQISDVINLYQNTNLRTIDIRKEVGLEDYVVQSILRHHFTQDQISERKSRMYANSKLGSKNPNYRDADGKVEHRTEYRPNERNAIYKDGVKYEFDGYAWIRRPFWYTGSTECRVMEHIIVMCEVKNLTELPEGYVVHHRNGNKHDNRIENLELLTRNDHMRFHTEQRKLEQGSYFGSLTPKQASERGLAARGITRN
jgi:hypothetical protein